MLGTGAVAARKIIILVMAGALVAGCATASPEPPTPTAIPPSATATMAPTATVLPTDTPFVPKGTVKIVSQSPDWVDISKGAQLAIAQMSGGLETLGYAVEYVEFFDQEDVDQALENGRQIIADEQILCGVGHYSSRVTLNATDLYHGAGLAFISPSSTNPKVTDRHYPEVSRVAGRDDVQALAAVKFVRERGAASVYIVRVPFDFFNRLADHFKREALTTDLNVIGDAESGGENESLVKKITSANPDLVFFAGFSDQSGPFFRQVREAGYTGMLLAADGDSRLGEAIGPVAIEGGTVFYMTGGAPSQVLPGTIQFAEDFSIRFDHAPRQFAAEAYDAAGICLRAIEDASKVKRGELPTRQEVASAIRELEAYKGIVGTYTFNANGDPLLANYYVLQVQHIDGANWDKNPVAGIYPLPPPD